MQQRRLARARRAHDRGEAAALEGDGDVVQGRHGGVPGAVELGDADGAARQGGRRRADGLRRGVGGDSHGAFSSVSVPARVSSGVISRTPQTTALRRSGQAHAVRRWPPRCGGCPVRPAPPPGWGSALPPARERAHCRHGLAAARSGRRSRREWLSAALVLLGLVGLRRPDLRPRRGRGGPARRGLADVRPAGPLRAGHRGGRPRLRPRADPARAASPDASCSGAGPSPYDALRRFTGDVTGARTGAAEDLPLRMARLLAEGTGAAWAQVWVVGRGSAAGWRPPGRRRRTRRRSRSAPGPRARAPAAARPARRRGARRARPPRARPARRSHRWRSACSPAWPSQAGLVLRGAGLRLTLEQRLAELSARARSCGARASGWSTPRTRRAAGWSATSTTAPSSTWSRSRSTCGWPGRSRTTAPERADALLAAQEEAADDAVATLVQLARGIYPPLLEEAGVAAALRAAADRRGCRRSRPHGDGAVPRRRSRRRRTSAAWRRSRTPRKHAGAATIRVEVDAGRRTRSTLTVDRRRQRVRPGARRPTSGHRAGQHPRPGGLRRAARSTSTRARARAPGCGPCSRRASPATRGGG